jgi:glucose/arabinose dehydrogenase
MNRIRRGRSYGWGPSSSCPGTSESGPRPVQPKKRWNPVIAPTGVAFCNMCGLSKTHGRLLVGSFLDRKIRKLSLTRGRRAIGTSRKVYRNRRGVLALEAAPNGRMYFSDKRGIYRLAQT